MNDTDRDIFLAYIDCGMNMNRTAKALFMHYNTVVYHFDRIKQNTGLDPRNPFDIVRLMGGMGLIDTVEVVRCKDCVYSSEAKVNKRGFQICPASGMDISDNDYCSYAERRADGT